MLASFGTIQFRIRIELFTLFIYNIALIFFALSKRFGLPREFWSVLFILFTGADCSRSTAHVQDKLVLFLFLFSTAELFLIR